MIEEGRKKSECSQTVIFMKCLIGQLSEKYQDTPSSVRDNTISHCIAHSKRALALRITERLYMGVLL